MLLWIVFGVISAAVLAAVLRPLLARDEACAPGAERDVAAVYKDQLAEIDAEREAGLIAPAEAEAARVEIARRLLATEDTSGAGSAAPAAPRIGARTLAMALSVVVPLAAVGIYFLAGMPGLPSAPESERAALRATIAAVEARLKQHPEEGQGWAVLAPALVRMERFEEAVHAYAEANRILGDDPERLAGIVDASRAANDGRFNDAARAALERLVALAPHRFDLKLWLAIARQQLGQLAAAEADLEKLASAPDTPADWKGIIAERLDAVRAMRQGEVMVDRLAQRLKAEGGDLASWQRLIRAYSVLGRKTEAMSALTDARARFKGDEPTLAALDAFAKSLGLDT